MSNPFDNLYSQPQSQPQQYDNPFREYIYNVLQDMDDCRDDPGAIRHPRAREVSENVLQFRERSLECVLEQLDERAYMGYLATQDETNGTDLLSRYQKLMESQRQIAREVWSEDDEDENEE